MSLGPLVISSPWLSDQNLLKESHEVRPKIPQDLLKFFWLIFTFKMPVFMKVTTFTVSIWFRLIWNHYGVKKLRIYKQKHRVKEHHEWLRSLTTFTVSNWFRLIWNHYGVKNCEFTSRNTALRSITNDFDL